MVIIPRITILNNKEQYLTTVDNSRKNSLRFDDDKLTIYLSNSAQMFEATFFKTNEDAQYLVVGNKLAFKYNDEDYCFTIVKVEENEITTKITALGIGLEAVNSSRESYESTSAKTIVDYIKLFDYEKMFSIGLNQIEDRLLKLSFSGETLLQRIFKLADNFNAEIKIYPILNDDHSIQKIVLDIYKKDAGDQGIGNYHPEIRLRYGNEVSTVKRTVDIMQLKTAIKPIGNNGLTLVGYQVDIKDSDNKQLYYSTEQSGYIYAPQARDRFPSNKTGSNNNDFYIEYTKTYNTDSQSELANLALADLKIDSEPNVSYETELFYPEAKIGDTIRIDDDGYQPKLMLEARITKLEICFTDPTKNKVTFSNFVELKSEIDPLLITKMKELAEQNKVYNAQILTDNTVVFKNNQGETTLIARVLDGIKDITDSLTITWLKGDLEVGNGKNLRVTAADVNGVQLYRFNAFKDGKLIAQTQISVADVVDGTDGQPGEDGQPGADGENAINAYLTNENITLKADAQGNLKSGQLALASGQMVAVDGPTVVTSGVSYSIVNQTGCMAAIDSTGNYRLTALTADSASVIFRASYKGAALQKTFNVNKLYDAIPGQNGQNGQDGKSPIIGYLTNENFIIQTNQDGSLNSQSLAKANGYFNVYQGQTKITNGVTYSIVSQTGVNVSLNATTGYYNVNSMSSDFGTAIFKAVYNDVELQKQLMVVKNKSAIGVVVADNPPSNPLVGQLWKNTGYGNGYLYGTTYYYNGSSWQVYLFYASNIQADNLSALSANLGTVRTGKMQSNDNLVSFDLDKKELYMRLNNSPGDEYYSGASNPGIKSQFWLMPDMFKYQHLEQPEQNGYYESGYEDDGFYVSDRSQMTKLVSYGVKFSDDLVLTASDIAEDKQLNVTLPYNLKGNLYKRGHLVTLTIPRNSFNFFAPNGDYIICDEEIPLKYAPIDEVAVTLHKYNGEYLIEPAIMHITSRGFIRITNSGYVSSSQYFAMSATATWISRY